MEISVTGIRAKDGTPAQPNIHHKPSGEQSPKVLTKTQMVDFLLSKPRLAPITTGLPSMTSHLHPPLPYPSPTTSQACHLRLSYLIIPNVDPRLIRTGRIMGLRWCIRLHQRLPRYHTISIRTLLRHTLAAAVTRASSMMTESSAMV